MIVVADASPLRYLVMIGEIEVLPVLYEFVVAPPAVIHELTREPTPDQVHSWTAASPGWLRVEKPRQMPRLPATPGPGECEAIALAEEYAGLLLVDDGAARREAHHRGIAIRGTLGTLGLAARHGLADLHRAIARLRATNFRSHDE